MAALEIGAVALIALAAGGVLVSTNPEYQQKVADVLASLPEAQKRNIENLTDLLGTEGFPIHKGDFGRFIFPVADKDTSTPATSGYGADGKVELPTHTGGDQIPQMEGGNTGFPVSELPAPGNMYNESNNGEVVLTQQQEKAIRSLQKQIDKHEQKIQDFKNSPTIRPGMENLPSDVIERQQQRRIEHLETEIRTFKNNIEKIKRGDISS
ncbi:hypothetical protein ACNFH5_09975 [Pseudomonas sp. NY15435]|uniref:hypothetical protein n=1 Tax=Pseudomonas sp. NY15435 TaxID=3400358 RepID=UPI003A88567A